MWPLTSLKWYLFKQSNQNNKDAMKTYNTLDKLCNDVSYASLSWLLTILKRFSDTAFSNREYGPLHPMLSCETDQIYSRADCEKSNNQIFSSLVSNKFSWISASFKLWYMIVSLLVMELFKKKDRPVSNNHPVYAVKKVLIHRYIHGSHLMKKARLVKTKTSRCTLGCLLKLT